MARHPKDRAVVHLGSHLPSLSLSCPLSPVPTPWSLRGAEPIPCSRLGHVTCCPTRTPKSFAGLLGKVCSSYQVGDTLGGEKALYLGPLWVPCEEGQLESKSNTQNSIAGGLAQS